MLVIITSSSALIAMRNYCPMQAIWTCFSIW